MELQHIQFHTFLTLSLDKDKCFDLMAYLKFLDRISKDPQISNAMKIRLVGAALFHADGQTDMTLFAILRKRLIIRTNYFHNTADKL